MFKSSQSNIRYFNTYFFEDTYIEDLNSDERLLYMTLFLNPHNNLAGCYEISIKKLTDYTALSSEKVKACIQKFQNDRKILFSGNWLALKNFIKNNRFNPNMAKKSFDIMKISPKDKIIFILSDQKGNAEPWLFEFVNNIESGINASIDSQNRNAERKALTKGVPKPSPIPHIKFGVQSLINTILTPKMGMVPQPLGEGLSETHGERLGKEHGEGLGEIRKELELEIKLNRNEYKNIETQNSQFIPVSQIHPEENPLNEKIANYWYTKYNKWYTENSKNISIPNFAGKNDFQKSIQLCEKLQNNENDIKQVIDFYWDNYESFWFYEKNNTHSFSSVVGNIDHVIDKFNENKKTTPYKFTEEDHEAFMTVGRPKKDE